MVEDAGAGAGAGVTPRVGWAAAVVPAMAVAIAAAVARAIAPGRWVDALLAGGAVWLVGWGATVWMFRSMAGEPRRVPGAFLAGSGVLLLGVVGAALAMILLLGREPVTSLLAALAAGWGWLAVETAVVRRSLRGDDGGDGRRG